MGTKNITHVEGGLPTVIDAEDEGLFGVGVLGSRPASGDFTGDLWLLDDGAGRYILTRWNGATWDDLTTTPAPAGSVDNRIARFDGTGGQIQNSAALLDDNGNIDNITNGDGQLNGTTHYADSATDPVSPTPAEGDRYYNTTLEMEMRYDGSRSKWLSVNVSEIEFSRNGNTAQNAYYRAADGKSYSATNGRYAEFAGTVVSIGYTRDDTDSATFEVTRDGTLVTGAALASTAVAGKSVALNADFAADGVLGVRNQAGGNTTSGVLGWVRVRWRA